MVSISSSNSSSFGHVLRHQSENNNILKLKLRKPKSWNWELSTSKSSAHIDFPRVLLYDTNNRLLADIEEANFIVNGKENELHAMPAHHQSHSMDSNDRSRTTKKSNSFCVSSSSTKSSLKNPIIKIESDSPSCGDNDIALHIDDHSSNGSRARTSNKSSNAMAKIEAAANDNIIDSQSIPNDSKSEQAESKLPAIPILIYSAKGLVQRDFNAKEFDVIRNRSNSQTNIKCEPTIEEALNRTESDKSHTAKTANKQHANEPMKPVPEHLLQLEKNPLVKCNTVAEILANALMRSSSSRRIRRSKSSASSKCPFRSASRKLGELSLPLSSSSSASSLNKGIDFKSMNNKKSAYRVQKSAAGTLIVPENVNSNGKGHRRHRRRRHRSNSVECFENNIEKSERNQGLKQKSPITSSNSDSISNRGVTYPMEMSPVDETSNNQLNGIARTACDKPHHSNKNRRKHSVSIKNENENSRLNAPSGAGSPVISNNNDVNSGNGGSSTNNNNNNTDTKQKKVQQQQQQQQQLHRKVSFVQVNDGMANKSSTDTIHNCMQEANEFNQNGKCISTIKSAMGRRKKVYGKIKKSASVAGYHCHNHLTTKTAAAAATTSASLFGELERKSASDTDDYDFYMKPPMRHKKRRVSQRPRSSTTTTTTTTNAIPYPSKSCIAILIVLNLDMEIVI